VRSGKLEEALRRLARHLHDHGQLDLQEAFVDATFASAKKPNLPRPYKAWWYPWSTLLVLLASAGFLLGSVIGDPKHSLFTAILMLLSYVASILIVREKHNQTG
jgi:hypothetical protein